MTLVYHKAEPTTLANAGFDEKWLQDRIEHDPSILGLGDDLTVIQREKKQSSGGRIDFLMREPEANTMYEVEIMLGRLDESHIIRAIEYWDIERRRWADREHRGVIVAEEITNRFFNIIDYCSLQQSDPAHCYPAKRFHGGREDHSRFHKSARYL